MSGCSSTRSTNRPSRPGAPFILDDVDYRAAIRADRDDVVGVAEAVKGSAPLNVHEEVLRGVLLDRGLPLYAQPGRADGKALHGAGTHRSFRS
jgi:hypothetical protein